MDCGTERVSFVWKIFGINMIKIFVCTLQFRDTLTNIVVVQFVSDIQTSMDIKYNLTCTTRGPGSAVVTSGLIGAGLGQNVFFSLKYFSHNLNIFTKFTVHIGLENFSLPTAI